MGRAGYHLREGTLDNTSQLSLAYYNRHHLQLRLVSRTGFEPMSFNRKVECPKHRVTTKGIGTL